MLPNQDEFIGSQKCFLFAYGDILYSALLKIVELPENYTLTLDENRQIYLPMSDHNGRVVLSISDREDSHGIVIGSKDDLSDLEVKRLLGSTKRFVRLKKISPSASCAFDDIFRFGFDFNVHLIGLVAVVESWFPFVFFLNNRFSK